MKKINIFFSLLMVALLGLTSCSEDKDYPPLVNPEKPDQTYGTGEWNSPITVSQLLGGTKANDAWFTGYIVGWIDTSNSNTYSVENVKFTTPCSNASNLVLAASPDERDIYKCIPVQLVSGTEVRSALNLKDNPTVLGKLVSIKGDVEKYFGQEAAVKNTSAYNWGDKGTEGTPTPPPGDDKGNGSAEKPYSVSQMLGGQSGTGVWVSGYIVGWVKSNPDGASTLTEQFAMFTAEGAVASNLMLADSPTETDYSKCTAINLPTGAIRTALNLSNNPGNLGKQVSIKGDLSKYFGVNGLRNPTEYNWGPTGTTGGSTPGDAIYSGLSETASSIDWTFDNIEMPSALSYIWSWKSYSNKYYLNASAFLNNTPYASKAWAISPVIDLSNVKTASVEFEHAAKFQTTVTTLCGFGIRESGSTTWTELSIPTWPTAGTWDFVSSGAIDISAFAGKKVEIGLKYESTSAGADTWEIKNLVITGTK